MKRNNSDNAFFLLSLVLLFCFKFFFNELLHESDDWHYFGAIIRYPTDRYILNQYEYGYHSPGYFVFMKYFVLLIPDFNFIYIVLITFLGVFCITSFGIELAKKILKTEKQIILAIFLLIVGWQGYLGFVTLSSPRNLAWHFLYPLIIYFSLNTKLLGSIKRSILFFALFWIHLPSFLIFFVYNEITDYIRNERLITLFEKLTQVILLLVWLNVSPVVWIGQMNNFKPLFLTLQVFIPLAVVLDYLLRILLIEFFVKNQLKITKIWKKLRTQADFDLKKFQVSLIILTVLLILFSNLSDNNVIYFIFSHCDLVVLGSLSSISIFKYKKLLKNDIWVILIVIIFVLASIDLLLETNIPSAGDPWRTLAIAVFSMAVLSAIGMNYLEKNIKNRKFVKIISLILFAIIIKNFIYTPIYFRDFFFEPEIDSFKTLSTFPQGKVAADPRYFGLIAAHGQLYYGGSNYFLKKENVTYPNAISEIAYVFWSNKSFKYGSQEINWTKVYIELSEIAWLEPIITIDYTIVYRNVFLNSSHYSFRINP